MIPISNFPSNEIEITKNISLSYYLNLQKEVIRKYVDDIEALKQAILKILLTERYMYPCYDWQYGIELNDLIGQPKSLVKAEIPRRVKDALLIDDRIEDVVDFSFEDITKTELAVTFYVKAYKYEELIQIDWRYGYV